MIFVTVGTQLPFDRLTAAVASVTSHMDEQVIAQVGSCGLIRPEFTCHRYLDPEKFDRLFSEARIVVAHAGIGTILAARRLRKPLVVMPRRYDLGEHRNDHQVATVTRMKHLMGVEMVSGEEDLFEALNRPHVQPAVANYGPQLDQLSSRLQSFIEGSSISLAPLHGAELSRKT